MISSHELDLENTVSELDLEAGSIDPHQLSLGSLMHEINLKNRPSWVLRLLMNTLEKKRMEKRLGWSRPWNKYDLTIFRSHRHQWPADNYLFEKLSSTLEPTLSEVPKQYQCFVKELLADTKRMAFTFYHNRRDEKGDYEGFTLSIGRKVVSDATKRDRFDIILEDRKTLDGVDGQLDSVRIYINPWDENSTNNIFLWEGQSTGLIKLPSAFQDLYKEGIGFYNQSKNIPERQWNHWANRYIDYFGARHFIPVGSQFL